MPDDDYSKALAKDGRDLVELAKNGTLPKVRFRDALTDIVVDHLDRGRSVLLVGAPGVGKTAVVAEVARRTAAKGRGSVFEISTTLLLSGTRYIGEWQSKVTAVARAAIASQSILYVTDVWNLPLVGRTAQSGQNLFDALKPDLDSGRLRLIGEATPQVLRDMHRTPGFATLFHTVEVPPLEPDQVDRILVEAAEDRSAALDASCRRTLVDLTTRFQAAEPQPGPALNLLEMVIDYREEKARIGEDVPIDRAFIERVFSIHSGLPAFVVSRDITLRERDIRDFFSARIVGQSEAISAVVETIALFKAGLQDATKPIGTFLFVGPTGVGKTEVARALATFIFGSPQRMLRFDLSEFKDYSSFELLLGDPERPQNPARLLGPVRAQPFQVVLFDELEKAHSNIWDLLLPLLDEGRLSGPGGDSVDFRNTVIIATSNVGAQDADASRGLGFGATGADAAERTAKIRRALELSFRPEFLNRFQHVVVFHRLSNEQMRAIARQEMNAVLARDGIASRGLAIDVEDEAIDFVIAKGVDARFGARALKREVQRRIVVPIAMTLMENAVVPGAVLRVGIKDGRVRVQVIDTEASREAAAAVQERESAQRQGATRAELVERTGELQKRIDQIASLVLEKDIEGARDALLAERQAPGFWSDMGRVERVQSELDRIVTTAERLEHLRGRLGDLRAPLTHAGVRPLQLDRLSSHVLSLSEAVDDAWRELVVMRWQRNAGAIVEVKPLGPLGAAMRRRLVDAYVAWADSRTMGLEWVCEPCEDGEPAVIAVKGPWAYGYLRGEAGLHRLRLDGTSAASPRRGQNLDGTSAASPRRGQNLEAGVSVAKVRVALWSERREQPYVTLQRALKAMGQHGGKVRSRMECRAPVASGALVLQNARTLSENRELAAELVASWSTLVAAPEDVVRRYDEDPPLVRDVATGSSSGRPDALSPHRFDALLKRRADLLGE
jgi:ATP-dependent Clp protease ATP-binding subunit ClpC